tara:strand:- start:1630 stop:2142 length:513 start_codon:yes stop_codon:yes gene_type:complete
MVVRKQKFNVKILDYKVLEVIPFNDYDPPADLRHMSRFKTAWLVEIDDTLHAFYFTKEECWLGDFVENQGDEVSFIERPIKSNKEREWHVCEEELCLYSSLPADEWMGITTQTEIYAGWHDDTQSDEEKAADKLLYDQFSEIYHKFSPDWDHKFPSDFGETEFDIELVEE